MKTIFFLIVSLYGFTLLAQGKEIKKPEYVIIANNEIITKEQVGELGQQGLIKAMNKGVTEDERNKLATKFGDKIGDREFIIIIDLLTEKEKKERKNQTASSDKKITKEKNRNDELILNINDSASEFTVEMIDGKKINLSDLKGQVVLVNYWATWCAPCLMEFAEFPKKILEPFKNEKFMLIAISIGETKEKVELKMDKMKKYGVDFNVGIDPEKEIWDKYATGAIPKSFLIDKNGIIKYISIGNSDGNVDKLATEVKKLLAE
ncbi:TlpA family protein disulfide reductase [Winogradskyella psychrotolerans]|uniref:TlpA family protein disulfide reductase n=1 Tax=Winogradskyella psychrotolerans TaxID=1344585 RepID=UPI001C07437C|nr:TlpA disulfide reductase family protein [Winogradskyella psychrotolerans]MBU2920029.1 TlpA family protein disulfide reductase [Winogradskyella psychrotolerans]